MPVTVVPGVTAACAAAATLQVPLTHRNIARSLHFVTGHGSDGTVPAHDWNALVGAGGTIAAYMAGRTFATVSAQLIAAGLSPTTPAVVVENASRSIETHRFGTLAELPSIIANCPPEGPALVLIGQVVALAETMPKAARLAA